jgi:Protein of unknown function (DUF3325)
MSEALPVVLALIAALAGMAAFALSNPAHWQQLLGRKPQTGRLRAACARAGWAFLGLSLLFCIVADPVSMAILVWPMLIGVSGAVVAAILTLHGRARRG